jgi:hypothetical protein
MTGYDLEDGLGKRVPSTAAIVPVASATKFLC